MAKYVTTKIIIKGLIPYTKENLLLSFKPNAFFNYLEKEEAKNKRLEQKISRNAIENAYHRAVRNGLIAYDDLGIPYLTEKAEAAIRKLEPKKLDKGARLMIIFDIPETNRKSRDRLRRVLRNYYFYQVQKSVWVTEYDVKQFVEAEIKSEGLQSQVQLYESYRLI